MALRDDGREVVRGPISGFAMVNVCAIALFVLFFWAQSLKATVEDASKGLFHRPAAQIASGTSPAGFTDELR